MLFIVEFQILLVICAFFLVHGNSATANTVAVAAYCLLLIGVILQLISFVRSERDNKNSE